MRFSAEQRFIVRLKIVYARKAIRKTKVIETYEEKIFVIEKL